MRQIGLMALENISNMGDEILADTVEFLLKQTDANMEVHRIPLCPSRRDIFREKLWLQWALGKVLACIAHILPSNYAHKVRNLSYQFRLKVFFERKLKNCDVVVYAVGSFKYSTQNLSYFYEIINRVASGYQIPVLMNAMSIERYEENDLRALQLIDAVNLPCVKMITTRDGRQGVERLKEFYLKRAEIEYDFVGDPALWIPDCYGIHKKENATIIGVNLIRRGIYADYGTDLSGEQLLEMYEDLLQELERRNLPYVLFCNGMPEDYAVGEELVRRMNLSQDMLLPRPQSARQLVEMISGFRAVFGARLHACITAFSLGIPITGLLWDQKLQFFSETMGFTDSFSNADELNGNTLVDKLEKALMPDGQGNVANKESYKKKTFQLIGRFLSE